MLAAVHATEERLIALRYMIRDRNFGISNPGTPVVFAYPYSLIPGLAASQFRDFGITKNR